MLSTITNFFEVFYVANTAPNPTTSLLIRGYSIELNTGTVSTNVFRTFKIPQTRRTFDAIVR